MPRSTRRRFSILVAALCLAPVVAGCSSDRTTGLVTSASIFGDWTVTSFLVLGQDVTQLGFAMSFTLNEDGTYSAAASGPGIECITPSCTGVGSYTYTSTHITMDPGTPDETAFRYTLSGNRMTWTGTIDGTDATLIMTRS